MPGEELLDFEMRKFYSWAVVCLAVIIPRVSCDHHERELIELLMKNYNPLERPVSNNSKPVQVNLGISLQQIVDLDEKNQILALNAWLLYDWKDHKLQWDPKKFGGIKDVRFPYGTIWKPDVLLYNSVDSKFDTSYPSNMIVSYDGTVNWLPPGIFNVACKIDITWFPFDEQLCFLKFGSWTYHGFKLDLRSKKSAVDTSDYIVSGEWALIETSVERGKKFYECCPEPYLDLKFFLRIRRKTLYYGFNLIIPCMVIALMSLLAFVLPPEACEKITLEITILLTVFFFLSILSNMTPPTSESVPVLGVFFSACMMIISASVVTTVLVINFSFRTADMYEMSSLTRGVFLYWLPWILRMKRPQHELTWDTLPGPFNPARKSESPERSKHEMKKQELDSRLQVCLHRLSKGEFRMELSQKAFLLTLNKVFRELQVVSARMVEEDEVSGAEAEWKFAAMVVDRLCLYTFSVVIIISSCSILLNTPYLVA